MPGSPVSINAMRQGGIRTNLLFTMSDSPRPPEGSREFVFYSGRISTSGNRPKFGGARRDRTDDLMLAKHALSQLSYGPGKGWWARVELNYRPHAYQACALTT